MGIYTEQQELNLLDELEYIKQQFRTAINEKMSYELLTPEDKFETYIDVIKEYLGKANIYKKFTEILTTPIHIEQLSNEDIAILGLISAAAQVILYPNTTSQYEAVLPVSIDIKNIITDASELNNRYTVIID